MKTDGGKTGEGLVLSISSHVFSVGAALPHAFSYQSATLLFNKLRNPSSSLAAESRAEADQHYPASIAIKVIIVSHRSLSE
jgi:hypothetical protein